MTDAQDQVWTLISGHFDGSLSVDERNALHALLSTDQTAADLFVQTARLHDKLHIHAKDNQAAIDEVIEFPQRKQQRILFALVAAILCCILGAYVFFSNKTNIADTTAQMRIEVVRGQVEVDGVHVQGIATLTA